MMRPFLAILLFLFSLGGAAMAEDAPQAGMSVQLKIQTIPTTNMTVNSYPPEFKTLTLRTGDTFTLRNETATYKPDQPRTQEIKITGVKNDAVELELTTPNPGLRIMSMEIMDDHRTSLKKQYDMSEKSFEIKIGENLVLSEPMNTQGNYHWVSFWIFPEKTAP
jgi:hypothetical protein